MQKREEEVYDAEATKAQGMDVNDISPGGNNTSCDTHCIAREKLELETHFRPESKVW